MFKKLFHRSIFLSFCIGLATCASSNTSISYEKEYYSTNVKRLEHIIKTELGIDRADLVLKYNLLNLKKDKQTPLANYEHASFIHFLTKEPKLEIDEYKDMMDKALVDLQNIARDDFSTEILAANLKKKIDLLSKISTKAPISNIKNQPDLKDTAFHIKTLCNNKLHELEKQFTCLAELDAFYTSLPIIEPLQNGRVTSNYGIRAHPKSHHKHIHRGIDLVGDLNVNVRVTAPGIVKEAYKSDTYGNMVLVEHKYGISTLYAHLDNIYVHEGESIDAGEVIGMQGNTGRSTGEHLHYEIRINDKQVNPSSFLKMLKIA